MQDPARDDPAARFDTLFTATHRRVLAYVVRSGVTVADADDVVADVYVVAWRRFDDVPVDHALPWLIAVARNLLRNRHRAGRRDEALLQRLRGEPPPVQAASEAALDEVQTVRRALAGLSGADRELLHLAAVEELSSMQIAMVLGCRAVTARVRLHRARARLRAALGRSGSDPDTDAAGRAAPTQPERSQA